MDTSARTGVTVVVGPANSGKMGLVLEWWEERLSLLPVVVLPTVPDAQETTAEMARRMAGLVGQSPAVTFDGLVRLILGRSVRYAADLERVVLTWGILHDDPLEALAGLGHLPGQAAALAALLGQLGESGKSPEQLDEALLRWGRSEPGAGPLATGLRRAAALYRERSADLGLSDRSAAMREALGVIEGWHRPVALYGFTSFAPGQRDIVEALAQHAQVLMVFTHRRGRDVGLVRQEDLEWWEARAARVVDTAPYERTYSSPAIAYLEKYSAGEEPRPELPPQAAAEEGVRFLLASGRRAEAESAAQQISELLRAGHKPGEIGVVVRQVRGWNSLISDVFDSCGISYQMDERCLLGETGLGHALLSALKGVASNDPTTLFAFFRSPYSGLDIEDADHLELRFRRGTGRDTRSLLKSAAGAGCHDLEWLKGRPGDRGPSRADADIADTSLEFDISEIGTLAGRMFVTGSRDMDAGDRHMEEDARALKAVQAVLSTILGLPAKGSAGAVDAQTLIRLLAQVGVSAGVGEEGDTVQVLSVQRARARRFETVIILGLVEGEFPCRPDIPSLLSGSQRARLDQIAGGLFTPERDQEEALFVSAASRARRLLYLSARDSEDDGSEAMPSRFWHSAKTLLGCETGGHRRRTLADLTFFPSEAPTLRHYLRGCASRGMTPDLAGQDESEVPGRLWRRPAARLTSPTVLADLAATQWFSPSGLEAYASCPFAWFIERVIRVRDIDAELDARTVGDLLHTVLSTTYRGLSEAGLLPLRESGVAAAEDLAFAGIDGVVWSSRCPGTTGQRRIAAWRLKRMVAGLFATEARDTGTFVPCETEMEVGADGPVDIGGLAIKGRVDRVDMAPGGEALFVIDYKSGGVPAPSALGSATGLQLPLYLMALSAEHPEVQVAGGAYLSLSDGRRVGIVSDKWQEAVGPAGAGYRVLDEEGVDELFDRTRREAQAAAAGMRAGAIGPAVDRECPPWCKIGPACRARRRAYRP